MSEDDKVTLVGDRRGELFTRFLAIIDQRAQRNALIKFRNHAVRLRVNKQRIIKFGRLLRQAVINRLSSAFSAIVSFNNTSSLVIKALTFLQDRRSGALVKKVFSGWLFLVTTANSRAKMVRILMAKKERKETAYAYARWGLKCLEYLEYKLNNRVEQMMVTGDVLGQELESVKANRILQTVIKTRLEKECQTLALRCFGRINKAISSGLQNEFHSLTTKFCKWLRFEGFFKKVETV